MPAGTGADGRAEKRGAAGWRRIALLDYHVHTPVVGAEVGGTAYSSGRGAEDSRQPPVTPRGQRRGAVRGPSGADGGCRRGGGEPGHE